jgi:hypothetical protein
MLLYGTFGSETLKLPEALLRELEGKLIEMSYQRQSSSTSQPSTPSQPRGSAPYFAASGKNNFTNGEQRLRMQEDNPDDF